MGEGRERLGARAYPLCPYCSSPVKGASQSCVLSTFPAYAEDDDLEIWAAAWLVMRIREHTIGEPPLKRRLAAKVVADHRGPDDVVVFAGLVAPRGAASSGRASRSKCRASSARPPRRCRAPSTARATERRRARAPSKRAPRHRRYRRAARRNGERARELAPPEALSASGLARAVALRVLILGFISFAGWLAHEMECRGWSGAPPPVRPHLPQFCQFRQAGLVLHPNPARAEAGARRAAAPLKVAHARRDASRIVVNASRVVSPGGGAWPRRTGCRRSRR